MIRDVQMFLGVGSVTLSCIVSATHFWPGVICGVVSWVFFLGPVTQAAKAHDAATGQKSR